MTKPEDERTCEGMEAGPDYACGRWPECQCDAFCEYWSGDGLQPADD